MGMRLAGLKPVYTARIRYHVDWRVRLLASWLIVKGSFFFSFSSYRGGEKGRGHKCASPIT